MTRLVHEESGRALADRIEKARTPFERMKGLLGRAGLEPGGGMWIERCGSIHTCFMRFPIDVVFADADMIVRKAARRVAPWRMRCARGARHVFELPAGALDACPVAAGDRLRVEEAE